jgi:iron(III) transport system substrate-binding protein
MKSSRHIWLAAILGGALLTPGCGGPSVQAETPDAGPQTLTIYTARDKEAVAFIVERFVRQYPQYQGRINVVTMSAQDALTRLRAERGNPQAGFLWGGTQQGLEQAAREGLLAPSTPDAAGRLDPSRRDPEGRWHAEMLLPEVIVYNHDRLTAEQAPKDWDDLIDRRFAGQIVIRDVMASGTMRTIFSAMVFRQFARTGSPNAGYEWLRALDANTVTYAANPDDMYFKLDRGVGTITLWNLQDVLIQSRRHRRPWSYVMPSSGAPVLVDGVAVVNNPKSLKVASEFQNFLLQPEQQLALARDYFQIPAVPLDDAGKPEWLANLVINEMPIDWAVMGQKQQEWMAYWSQNIQGRRQ